MSKDKYKVTNWSSYNNGLKKRGSINLWISSDLSDQWKWGGQSKRGGQYQYSNVAIELCLTVGKVYSLALRQTEGFMSSFFEQCGWKLSVPSYTTLCRRSQGLVVNLRNKKRSEITDIVVDSTGLKVYGEGEWKVRKHGAGKHRTWMKMHLVIDAESQQIKGVKLTSNSIDDSTAAIPMIESIKYRIGSLRGDGGYDKHEFRKMLRRKNIRQIIPPQSNAVINYSGLAHLSERNKAVKKIWEIGRDSWKIENGYHQRSKIETAMFRYKMIIGDHLTARKNSHQETEVAIGCKILNIMLKVAKPESIKVN
jgi:IS5 family transposase